MILTFNYLDNSQNTKFNKSKSNFFISKFICYENRLSTFLIL